MESALNSFVPSLDNEDDPPELIRAKWEYRMTRWNEITKQQFQLSYFGTIPYDVSDQMPIHEREHVFGLLREQKAEEKKAEEKKLAEKRPSKKSPYEKDDKDTVKRTTIEADSMEELLEKIKNIDWNNVADCKSGDRFDFSV